ncbi:MAG TPA: alpha-2-macroglobulin [Leptospiraceae bacterium]|nr:alpha-2-macroglobulin [Leptospiraceae bacterium]
MESRVKVIQKRILNAREARPPVFRTAVMMSAAFALVLGGCSSFQLFKKLTRTNATVSGPEYVKPSDETSPSSVSIHFSNPAVRIDLIGKTADIQMKPSHPGTWTFVDDSTITFVPSQHWPAEKSYSVTLKPEFFSPSIKLDDYQVGFETAPFTVTVASAQFYIDPKDPRIKKAVITLDFSHPVDAKSISDRVSFEYKDGLLSGKPLANSVTLDATEMRAFVHSDIVSIQEKEASLVFNLKSGIHAKDGGGSSDSVHADVPVPGKYTHFFIDSTAVQLVRNESYELDQVLFVETTASITPEELAKNITAYELPKNRPASPGTSESKNHQWQVKEIDEDTLAHSRKLQFVRADENTEEGTVHPYKIQAQEGAQVFVRVGKNTRAVGDFLLKEKYESIVRVPDFQREARIMHDGAILSLSGEKRISVLSYDNDALEFEIGRIMPDQINHLISQSYGNFNSPYFSNYNFNEDNISERYTETIQLNREKGKRLQYASFDFSKYLSAKGPRLQNGLFYLKVRGVRKKKQDQETENEGESDEVRIGKLEDKRLVLVSDLGILVKAARSGTRDVFVQSFAQGFPVAGVEVSVIGKNGMAVATQTTDANGHATLANLSEFTREKAPVAFIAKAGSDLSFMPFARDDRKLDFSRFDVGGLQGADSRDKLTAFIFSDRGMYRPGDEIRAGLIIKSGDWKRNLSGLPVEVSILDPRGIEVFSRLIKLSPSAFEEIKYKTEETSPTGSYQIRAMLVPPKKYQERITLGQASVRVEEFLPDKLRITTQFSQTPQDTEGWVKPEQLKGQVLLMNLFGTPAQHKKVQATLVLTPRFPAFSGYEGYRFYDPLRTTRSFQQDLGTLETDDQGKVEFPLGLEKYAKGLYWVTFHADGFESEGGRAVSTQSLQMVSPLSAVVGIKSDGDANYIHKGSARAVSIIAIDEKLKPVSLSKLKLRIVEQRPMSSLVKREDGVYEYKSIVKEIPVLDRDLIIPQGGFNQLLPTDQSGDFVLSIVDESSQELNRFQYSVIGQGNLTRSLERNAELSIRLSGKDFSPGEEIEMAIRAPYVGAGLITIEKDKVYAYKWFKTATESSVQRIRMPEGLEGNAYVNVSFVRSLDSKAIYTSPLSFGVAPFSVSKKSRTAAVTLNVPAEIRPGDTLRIQYRTDRPGKIVLYAVDEGILQVAKYRTPDPLGHFFQKRALEVSTSQIVDQLLPEFSIVRSLMKMGGDADRLIGLNLNPFKRKRALPVAFWSGIRDSAGAGEVSFTVPDYFNGRVRVFAVLVNESVLGVEEKSVIVRGDFILSPSVPAFSAPGDTMNVSTNVANNVIGSGNDLPVRVEARAEGSLEIVGDNTAALRISEKGEKTARFQVRAKSPGEGRIIFMATSAGKAGKQTETISVRPARPYILDVESGYLAGGSDSFESKRTLYPDFRKLEVSVSPVPLAWSSGLFAYLENYPYGCTEQITSRGFAALVLRNRPELARGDNDKIISNTISVLRARQNDSGSFGFWAPNSYVDPFQSTYALLFLTEAKERGVTVPDAVLSKGMNYLESMSSSPKDATLHDRAFALYVLARNGKLHANEVNSLLIEASREKDDFVRLPYMYLAATRKLMKQDKEATDLFEKSQPGVFSRWIFNSFDPVSANASYMYLLSRHFPGSFETLSDKTMQSFFSPMKQGQFSTISAASMILAIDAYLDLRHARRLDLKVTQELGSGEKRPLLFPDGLFAKSVFLPEARKIKFDAGSPLPAFYQVTVGGFDEKLPAPYANGIEISREFTDQSGNKIQSAEAGQEVYVRIRIRAKDTDASNIAIVDLFPGGFEPVFDEKTRTDTVGIPGFKPALMEPDHVEMREDRIVLFTRATSRASEYTYRLRAVSAGKFVVPPLFAEAMYQKSTRALTGEGQFEIKTRK